MRITSLILTGFKSFGKKSQILIDSDITAIVGPNGSGKSNVAEAIRFVLGEQSIKSMRGSKGTDLIFKGSRELAPLSRASVTIVFDNKGDKPSILATEGGLSYLQYDEIRVTREIFADGQNEYSINETKVRLRDVQELFASAGIGSTHHTLISQGEADKVLSTGAKDRKEIIEDSLGLKVFQFRIKEAQKKLEKTVEYLKEGDIARREIAPHLEFLKKQVKKIHERAEIIDKFKKESALYFGKREVLMLRKKEELAGTSEEVLRANIVAIDEAIGQKKNKIAELEHLLTQADVGQEHTEHIGALSKKRDEIHTAIDEIRFSIRNLARELETIESAIHKATESFIETRIEESRISSAKSAIHHTFDQILWRAQNHEYSFITNLVHLGKHETEGFFSLFTVSNQRDTSRLHIEKNAREAEKAVLEEKMNVLLAEKQHIESEIQKEENAREEKRMSSTFALKDIRMLEQDIYAQNTEKNKIISIIDRHIREKESYDTEVRLFTEEVEEGYALIGADILGYKKITAEDIAEIPYSDFEHKKIIDRLKIKLEESGISNSADIEDEFAMTARRDEELSTQIEDLQKTKISLESLITELEAELTKVFDDGLARIDSQFNRFFAVMFGGGSAMLHKTQKIKRRKTKDTDIDLEGDDAEEDTEEGIDIEVNLPHKKIKDISMLSGGERALTSIALLFAMSQVTPPPFMVLDETDAALDEANARRYGAMLKLLAEHSKLIVITHNRETMSSAQSLFGVTLGRDGASKILSVKFDEAAAYAK